MRVTSIPYLVGHAGAKDLDAAIFQLGVKFALDAEDYVSFLTPVIGFIAG